MTCDEARGVGGGGDGDPPAEATSLESPPRRLCGVRRASFTASAVAGRSCASRRWARSPMSRSGSSDREDERGRRRRRTPQLLTSRPSDRTSGSDPPGPPATRRRSPVVGALLGQIGDRWFRRCGESHAGAGCRRGVVPPRPGRGPAQLRVHSLEASVSVIEHGRSRLGDRAAVLGPIALPRAPEAMSLTMRRHPGRRRKVVADSGRGRVGRAGRGRWSVRELRAPQQPDGRRGGRTPAAHQREHLCPSISSFPRQPRPRPGRATARRAVDRRPAGSLRGHDRSAGPAIADGLPSRATSVRSSPPIGWSCGSTPSRCVPLLVEVRATDDQSRPFWQQRHGLADTAGQLVLARFASNSSGAGYQPLPICSFPFRQKRAGCDAGFVDGSGASRPLGHAATYPRVHAVPNWNHRCAAGLDPITGVDGRAWVTITSTEAWQGARLFGRHRTTRARR